ncbi:MAG: Ca-activated chloride channel family protein [Saprospiraceae bacterium]|jgi:Ca-activated chloride channel family protein
MKKIFFYSAITLMFFACQTLDNDGSYPSGDAAVGSDSPVTSWGEDVTSGDGYNEIIENSFIKTSDETTSTFSIDADGGSYSNIRNLIEFDQEIPKYAVRTEELINYFQYDYAVDNNGHPISLNGEVATCPWNNDHKILRIGIKGEDIEFENLPASNIVFLIDVSGSMSNEEKLPLLQKSFKKLVDKLRDEDRIAIVTYASNAGIALESTSCSEKEKIKNAIDNLTSGGSTNGSGGIVDAYKIANDHFVQGGNNRVILASDGDFNVGLTSQEELLKLIEEKREEGIFLTTIGVGRGNYQDGQMEQIANHGNGTYEYIDSEKQADKVFIEEFGKLYTVAKDVKVQVEFNQRLVEQYRLIGYENRVLNNEDFEDDNKDAGEIGVGQTITALYEIIPANMGIDPLTEQTFSIDFRYKLPNEDASQLITLDVDDELVSFDNSSENTRFAVAVAGLGMILFDSDYKNDLTINDVKEWVDKADIYNPDGYKDGLKDLLDKLD